MHEGTFQSLSKVRLKKSVMMETRIKAYLFSFSINSFLRRECSNEQFFLCIFFERMLDVYDDLGFMK